MWADGEINDEQFLEIPKDWIEQPNDHGGIVIDNTAPSLTIPSDKIFEAIGLKTSLTDAQIGMANATDNVDTNPTISNNSTGLFLLGNTVILWTATDSSGNTATKEQTITIQDPLESMFVLEDMTTDTCQIQIQLGHSKEISLDECDPEYAGVPYISIPRSLHFGDVKISDDGTTIIIIAPNSVDSPLELVDEFGVTIDYVTHNRPRVDVQVIYYE